MAKIPNNTDCCGNCAFSFHPEKNSFDPKEKETLNCNRYPLTVIGSLINSGGQPALLAQSVSPVVTEDYVCGEHTNKIMD